MDVEVKISIGFPPQDMLLSCSSLNMELWNLEGGGTGGSIGQQPGVSQPFLVANRGIPPTSNFNVTANAWTFDPETSLTDLAGESLSRPYLKVA